MRNVAEGQRDLVRHSRDGQLGGLRFTTGYNDLVGAIAKRDADVFFVCGWQWLAFGFQSLRSGIFVELVVCLEIVLRSKEVENGKCDSSRAR